ncbi:uncharacterized protein LODBEIA_P42630 [Lodderomyces beijingensis]|uniref:Mog1p/PsbP-like protein n=1 Tax=Lodderomyces beijingensis TaxID=1775926 RepID=A0ABP0ZQ46_9ASCO
MATDKLYGGAIEIAKLPPSFIDVSTIRQVPDTQEVFIHQIPDDATTESAVCYDQSLIFDLLEQVSSVDYAMAIAEHMQDIAPANVENHSVQQVELEGIKRYFSYVSFKPEYKRQEAQGQAQWIILLICLIRLTSVETDVVVQYNIPFKSEDGVKDVEFGKLVQEENAVKDGKDGQKEENEKGKSQVEKLVLENYRFFKNTCESFKVVEWDLFA